MSNDLDIKIKVAVENSKEVSELQKEIIKLGKSSKDVDKQVDKLSATLSGLARAASLKETNAELGKTANSIVKAETAQASLNTELEKAKNFGDVYEKIGIKKLENQVKEFIGPYQSLADLNKLIGDTGSISFSKLKTGATDLGNIMVGLVTHTKDTFKAFITGTAGVSSGSIAAAKASDLLHKSLSKVIVPLYAINKAMELYNAHMEAMAAKQALVDAEAKSVQMYADSVERLAELKRKEAEAVEFLTKANIHSTLSAKEQFGALERVDAILAKTGTSVEELQYNISKSSREVVDDFSAIANSGIYTSKIISHQLAEALKTVKTPEEMNLLMSEFNMLSEQGKISASVVIRFAEELNNLNESFKNGTIAEAEFTEQKNNLVDKLDQQVKGFSQVNAEITKQIELIDVQLQQDKQVTESLIKKLEAEKQLAEAQRDTAKAQQLSQQIERARIDLMNRESGLMKQSTILLKQELDVLLKRQDAGEKLTEEEKKHIISLQTLIETRENEAEAIRISALAKEQDAASTNKNAKSLDGLVSSVKGVTDANKSLNDTLGDTSDSLDEVDSSSRRTTSSTRETGKAMKITNHILDGMADHALMSAAANDALTESINRLNRHRVTSDAGFRDLQHSIANQINYFTELEKKIDDVENASYDQVVAWERMASSLNYVNEENIDGLKKKLETMKNAALSLYADLDSKNADLFNQLNGMRWEDESYKMRINQQNEVLRLDEEIRKAREEGDNEVIKRLEKQKALTVQIHNQQRKDMKTTSISKREEKKTVDININGEDVSQLDPNDPRFIRKVADTVVKVIEEDYNKSTWGKAERIR